MANRITLNSVSQSAFRVNANDVQDNNKSRAAFVAKGRMLAYEHAGRGKDAMALALNGSKSGYQSIMTNSQYNQLNEQFQQEHLLYAAKKCCEFSGARAPENFDEFKRQGQRFFGNSSFYAVLQGIYEEVVQPILPATYSEAVGAFAETVEVGFGETYVKNIQSNDIPVFQDSSWGATLSVPSNRLYSDTITLNPQPKSAQIVAKWTQLVGNGMDFGAFFANIAAGMYSKTMAMWTESIIKASTNAQLIPTNMQYTFNNTNWMTAANKLATLNNTTIGDIFATGSMVPLSRVLPTQATGSTNVNMDAALAMLLGSEYNRSGLLGEFLGVRLMPLRDAIVPGTQNTAPATLLPSDRVWMMAGRGYKPMTVCYNRDTPISIEIDPTRTANFEIGINLTIALDIVAVFASRVATFSPI